MAQFEVPHKFIYDLRQPPRIAKEIKNENSQHLHPLAVARLAVR